MPNNNKALLLMMGVIAIVAVTFGANAYVARDTMTPDKEVTQTATTRSSAKKESISWNEPVKAPAAQPVQQVKKCDDGNIVGAGLGAVAGGLVGNQFGKGKGKDLATIGGAIAGGTAGHQMIPTRGVLCR